MRSIVPAILCSLLLILIVVPVVSATGVPAAAVAKVIAAPPTIALPTWGYALLGVNLVVAGGLAALPFLSK